jgi:hypothetical protein
MVVKLGINGTPPLSPPIIKRRVRRNARRWGNTPKREEKEEEEEEVVENTPGILALLAAIYLSKTTTSRLNLQLDSLIS